MTPLRTKYIWTSRSGWAKARIQAFVGQENN